MARTRTAARELVAAFVAFVIAVVTGIDWIGKPLRLVHAVTLVALGTAAGVALSKGMMRLRQDREGKGSAPAA